MYTDKKKIKNLANKINKEYGQKILCNNYKTLLFRTHIKAAIEHLNIASEYLEDDPINDDTDTNQPSGFWISIIIIITTILILLSLA